jgi:glycosyltransferase involved in cell wall biosynthesis
MPKMDISVVIPTYNEEKNVILLHRKIKEVLDSMGKDYEIIFVDDGSRDKTFQNLQMMKQADKRVKIIKFRSNFGQTAALDAGFKQAKGDVIIAMDADLQNDPADIPRLIAKLNQGYDCVSGWRKNRKDPLTKHIASRGANLLRKIIIHDKIQDSGCTLKAYRKECFEDLDLYGEMHRFIPALLQWRGFKITELPVKHHPRKYGKTKYSMKRVIKGMLDMIVVKFWMGYSARPIHLFGGFGILMGLIGFVIALYLVIVKLFYGQGIANRPLLLLAALLMILGVQFLIFGVLADIMIKVYYGEKRKSYSIEKIL